MSHDGTVKIFNFTSGWVDTSLKFAQYQGLFEANISMPTRSARGVWPAFWLMPEGSQCWPTGGEIDILEMNGDPLQDRVWASYHWALPGECGKDKEPIPGGSTRGGPHDDWQMDWHVYSAVWDTTSITYYLDGRLYHTVNASAVLMPTAAMHVIFDQAVDPLLFPPHGDHDTSQYKGDGVSMRVAWVRAYART